MNELRDTIGLLKKIRNDLPKSLCSEFNELLARLKNLQRIANDVDAAEAAEWKKRKKRG